jgi:hypothetical protein
MSSMETHLAGSSEDVLLKSLHFDSKRSCNYISSRNEVSYASSSGGSFSPTSGIRVMRFSLNDNSGAFLDGQTVRLAFTIKNEGAAAIRPISSSCASLFRRYRLTGGGVEIADIGPDYGRYHEMRSMLLSSGEKLNNLAEGWGGTATATLTAQDNADPIPAGGERRVMCKFFCHFLGQNKKILLSALSGLVLELELGDAADCFAEEAVTYTIIRPTILATLLQCDASIMSSFSQHLLSGKALSYNCSKTAFCMKSVVTSSTFTLPIARGFSRISTVLFSFHCAGKEVTIFNHPLAGAAPTGDNDSFRFHVAIGSFKQPVFDVEGVAEQFHRTRTAISILDRDNKSIDITPYVFRNTKAILALNLEKAINEEDSDLGNTGLSTKNGSQMTLQLRGCPQNADGTPVMLHVTLLYDSITQLSAAGVIQME